jgi:hypothetical protein
MQAADERAQIELNLRKRGATFPLILNVLADRLPKRCQRYQSPIGGATKCAIQLFRKGVGKYIVWW